MAYYKDVTPDPAWGPEDVYKKIQDLLIGKYSVEVVSAGNSVFLRVWFGQHCDPANHTEVP